MLTQLVVSIKSKKISRGVDTRVYLKNKVVRGFRYVVNFCFWNNSMAIKTLAIMKYIPLNTTATTIQIADNL